ncbi:hypothetical protein FM120_03705 [Sphingobacterium faecium PCAi_F2.5]|nr:hypothetical protein FM120_03705 [Sphingobacterium faecium PCAi_F2.5]
MSKPVLHLVYISSFDFLRIKKLIKLYVYRIHELSAIRLIFNNSIGYFFIFLIGIKK